jgi:hypothetical protein
MYTGEKGWFFQKWMQIFATRLQYNVYIVSIKNLFKMKPPLTKTYPFYFVLKKVRFQIIKEFLLLCHAFINHTENLTFR